jgi:hypothetical protein
MCAIALYVNERSPMPIRTLWRDETGAALDPVNAIAYVQMLRKVLELGHFHHVFFISHNAAAAALADTQIRVGGGTAVIVHAAVRRRPPDSTTISVSDVRASHRGRWCSRSTRLRSCWSSSRPRRSRNAALVLSRAAPDERRPCRRRRPPAPRGSAGMKAWWPVVVADPRARRRPDRASACGCVGGGWTRETAAIDLRSWPIRREVARGAAGKGRCSTSRCGRRAEGVGATAADFRSAAKPRRSRAASGPKTLHSASALTSSNQRPFIGRDDAGAVRVPETTRLRNGRQPERLHELLWADQLSWRFERRALHTRGERVLHTVLDRRLRIDFRPRRCPVAADDGSGEGSR